MCSCIEKIFCVKIKVKIKRNVFFLYSSMKHYHILASCVIFYELHLISEGTFVRFKRPGHMNTDSTMETRFLPGSPSITLWPLWLMNELWPRFFSAFLLQLENLISCQPRLVESLFQFNLILVSFDYISLLRHLLLVIWILAFTFSVTTDSGCLVEMSVY